MILERDDVRCLLDRLGEEISNFDDDDSMGKLLVDAQDMIVELGNRLADFDGI